jgi:hypothetical protein
MAEESAVASHDTSRKAVLAAAAHIELLAWLHMAA